MSLHKVAAAYALDFYRTIVKVLNAKNIGDEEIGRPSEYVDFTAEDLTLINNAVDYSRIYTRVIKSFVNHPASFMGLAEDFIASHNWLCQAIKILQTKNNDQEANVEFGDRDTGHFMSLWKNSSQWEYIYEFGNNNISMGVDDVRKLVSTTDTITLGMLPRLKECKNKTYIIEFGYRFKKSDDCVTVNPGHGLGGWHKTIVETFNRHQCLRGETRLLKKAPPLIYFAVDHFKQTIYFLFEIPR